MRTCFVVVAFKWIQRSDTDQALQSVDCQLLLCVKSEQSLPLCELCDKTSIEWRKKLCWIIKFSEVLLWQSLENSGTQWNREKTNTNHFSFWIDGFHTIDPTEITGIKYIFKKILTVKLYYQDFSLAHPLADQWRHSGPLMQGWTLLWCDAPALVIKVPTFSTGTFKRAVLVMKLNTKMDEKSGARPEA